MTQGDEQVVVEGAPLWGTPLVGLLYVLVGMALVLLAWLDALLGAALPRPVRSAGFVLFAALALCGSWALLRHGRARRGSARIGPDGVDLAKGARQLHLDWADLAGYALPSADYVQLRRADDARPDPWLTVPTPGAGDRERVVAALEAHGLSRLERDGHRQKRPPQA